jgi:hypothetical protein
MPKTPKPFTEKSLVEYLQLFNTQSPSRNKIANCLPINQMYFAIPAWTIPKKVTLKALQLPSYACW